MEACFGRIQCRAYCYCLAGHEFVKKREIYPRYLIRNRIQKDGEINIYIQSLLHSTFLPSSTPLLLKNLSYPLSTTSRSHALPHPSHPLPPLPPYLPLPPPLLHRLRAHPPPSPYVPLPASSSPPTALPTLRANNNHNNPASHQPPPRHHNPRPQHLRPHPRSRGLAPYKRLSLSLFPLPILPLRPLPADPGNRALVRQQRRKRRLPLLVPKTRSRRLCGPCRGDADGRGEGVLR